MAILKISRVGNSHAAMRNVLQYILNKEKTDEDLIEVVGDYQGADLSYDQIYQDYKRIKELWDKDSGRMYGHYILSFAPDEKITHKECLEFAKELMKQIYPNHQITFAVHKDKDTVHCHMIINSVSFLDGNKFRQSKKDLERYKELVNQMCKERNLTIAEKGKHYDGTDIEKGYISSFDKDKYNLLASGKSSYLVDCINSVLASLKEALSKDHFISLMKEKGWITLWSDSRKNITFENGDGKKVRDSNLSKTFNVQINKEMIENEISRNRDQQCQPSTYSEAGTGATTERGEREALMGECGSPASISELTKSIFGDIESDERAFIQSVFGASTKDVRCGDYAKESDSSRREPAEESESPSAKAVARHR